MSICATADRWLQLQTEGTRLLEQGKYGEARQSYAEALSVADEVGIVGSRLAQTLNNLGASCYHMARYAEAESYYQRAMQIWKPNVSPITDLDVAGLWSNVAALYTATGKFDRAEALYHDAIQLTGGASGEAAALRIRLTDNLAELYLKQGRPTAAEPLLLSSLPYLQSRPESATLALLLVNLGQVQESEHHYPEAEHYYQEALRLHEKLLGPNHPKTAICLDGLGTVYHALGRDREAVPLLQRAVAIDKAALGPLHPDLATRWNNLGSALEGLGHFNEAESAFRSALDIWEKAFGADSVVMAVAWNNLGDLNARRRQFAAAENFERRALEIWSAHDGPASPRRPLRCLTWRTYILPKTAMATPSRFTLKPSKFARKPSDRRVSRRPPASMASPLYTSAPTGKARPNPRRAAPSPSTKKPWAPKIPA